MLVSRASGSELIEAQPSGDNGEPAAKIIDLVDVFACQPEKCLLCNVLGLADVTEHLVGQVHQVGTVAAPGRVHRRRFGHALTTKQARRKLRIEKEASAVTFSAAASSLIA